MIETALCKWNIRRNGLGTDGLIIRLMIVAVSFRVTGWLFPSFSYWLRSSGDGWRSWHPFHLLILSGQAQKSNSWPRHHQSVLVTLRITTLPTKQHDHLTRTSLIHQINAGVLLPAPLHPNTHRHTQTHRRKNWYQISLNVRIFPVAFLRDKGIAFETIEISSLSLPVIRLDSLRLDQS